MNQSATQFSITKALEFVGDNSTYQKNRLTLLSILILLYAVLNSQLPLISSAGVAMLFVVASGIGQIITPVYMSLKTISQGLFICCLLAIIFQPFSQYLFSTALLGIGFFGRGFYVSSFIYLNEIGGDKFRAWSCIVIFGAWGVAPLLLALTNMTHLSKAWINMLFIFVPMCVCCLLVRRQWKRSPLNLYMKKMYQQAKQVLNDIAKQNKRAYLPYNLQGEAQADENMLNSYKKLTYQDFIAKPIIRKITIPLLFLWIYRQYIYYGSFMIVPHLGEEVNKNLILLSVSQIVAALMSYPIKLKIKRTNAFFGFVSLITICCFIASFFTLDQQCMPVGESCSAKHIYRFSTMLIRFSISLIGSILVNYTLELYPSNIRNLGFSLALGVSSIGSMMMPWIVQGFLSLNLSGFIAFFLASCGMIYGITFLQQTNGVMRTETVQQMQNSTPIINLDMWARLDFK